MAREVADYNLFMMCASLKREALSPLPVGFSFRNCRPSELDLWKEMHFDNPEEVQAYRGFMDDFFEDTYRAEAQAFFERTLFACDPHGRPVGTCLLWPAYGKLNTLHWLKVVKGYEGLGLGRALISAVLKDLSDADFPVYLHTQPGSFRAIKLYADFGFQVLQDPQ
ncbi:MAG: GNAT family N-acetyltransferase, partial [Bacteroidota bacterium]